LILAAVATLARLSRQAQRLGEAQLNFVAGVSHEFRTPLTVIRTAAFNLQGKLAGRPEQVAPLRLAHPNRNDRLTALVEQVLRFAGAGAGHVIRAREPYAVDTLIDEGLHSSRAGLEGPSLVVEKHIEPNLPFVLADGMAMRHALQNLVDNALKYGTEVATGSVFSPPPWIPRPDPPWKSAWSITGPVSLSTSRSISSILSSAAAAPFKDQVHGTGLGLNLVKRIVKPTA